MRIKVVFDILAESEEDARRTATMEHEAAERSVQRGADMASALWPMVVDIFKPKACKAKEE